MAFSIRSILLRSQSQAFRRKAGAALGFTAVGVVGLALATSKDMQQRMWYGSRKQSIKFPEGNSQLVRRAMADSASDTHVALMDNATDRKIVFAFDTTDASQFAFSWALDNFFHSNDTVLLLNVRPRNDPPQEIEGKLGTPLSERSARLQEMERLDRIHYELSEARGKEYENACRAKGIACQAVHAMGNPAVRICDVGAENQADCIVLGTHDRGALGRLTIGGVPTYVVHNAHCPVVVARPKKAGPVVHESPYQQDREEAKRRREEDKLARRRQEDFNKRTWKSSDQIHNLIRKT